MASKYDAEIAAVKAQIAVIQAEQINPLVKRLAELEGLRTSERYPFPVGAVVVDKTTGRRALVTGFGALFPYGVRILKNGSEGQRIELYNSTWEKE